MITSLDKCREMGLKVRLYNSSKKIFIKHKNDQSFKKYNHIPFLHTYSSNLYHFFTIISWLEPKNREKSMYYIFSSSIDHWVNKSYLNQMKSIMWIIYIYKGVYIVGSWLNFCWKNNQAFRWFNLIIHSTQYN